MGLFFKSDNIGSQQIGVINTIYIGSQRSICKHLYLYSFFFAVFFLVIESASAQLVPADLRNWNQEGLIANGNWTVSEDGTSVKQSVNGSPTFFVSPDTLINTKIRGKFKVETTSDDDFIGFVFGFRRPQGEEEYFDFILFDWKQIRQTFSPWTAEEGFTLSRVEGIVTGNLSSGHVPWWSHEDTVMQVLDTFYGDTLGWADNKEYLFELTYEENRIIIAIDSSIIFDVNGEFPAGRFGFYNYSQPNVRYQGFSLNQFPVAQDDSVMTPYLAAVDINILGNDYDPEGHSIHLERVYQPEHGSVLILDDSVVTYVPDSLFSGEDMFSYVIRDSLGAKDSAHVYITVEPSLSIGSEFTGLPSEFSLNQNYPNPFNPKTNINYELPVNNIVDLSIYNLLGQKVAILVSERQQAGSYNVEWDATGFSSGVYFYSLRTTSGFIQTRKLILLR